MLRNSQSRYGSVAIVLHWMIALLMLGQIAVGLTMTRLHDQRLAFGLIQWHKSFGFLTLALVLLRIGWRLLNRPPPLPASMPDWEKRGAGLSHALLYGLMLALPVSGWVLVSVSTLAIPTYAFYLFVIPHLPLAATDAAETAATATHHWLAYLAIAVLALHGLAALRHHFVLRDDVLKRMLPTERGARK